MLPSAPVDGKQFITVNKLIYLGSGKIKNRIAKASAANCIIGYD